MIYTYIFADNQRETFKTIYYFCLLSAKNKRMLMPGCVCLFVLPLEAPVLKSMVLSP